MYREWLVSQPRWMAGLVGVGCAVAAGLVGPIAIDLEGEAPMTAQTLLILMPGLLFGWEVGVGASVLYLVAGGLGAPVFAHFTSGWERFTGTTGGYLLAFPIAALVVGWWAPKGERFRFLRSGLLLFAGQILIVALGMAWQLRIVPVEEEIGALVSPLLPGLVMKTAVGTLILTGIGRVVDRARRN